MVLSLKFPCIGLALLLGFATRTPAAPATADAPKLSWQADLKEPPRTTGWELGNFGQSPFDGGWIAGAPKSKERQLLVRQGYWLSPPLAVKPFHYYRAEFSAISEKNAYWAAVFYDATGREIVADNYDTIDASAELLSRAICFRGHAEAVQVRLRFQADGQPLTIKAVGITEISAAEAAAWAETLAAANPTLGYEAPASRCALLPKTMKTLREGGTLRVVMLGDSICNDTSNSLFETLLESVYPQARIEVITSVRGGTGCQYYQHENRVQDYVLRFQPDLVIIAGISHGYDTGAMRSVIQQIRAGSRCEILVMSGALTGGETLQQGYLKNSGLAVAEALENLERFPARLRKMAGDERVEYLDMRRAWEDYVAVSPRPPEWFLRDPIHGNGRGKQVLARILLRYFEPFKP